MSVSQFNLPDVGEGLTEAEIVSWKVKPGDAVRVNDVIVEIETAKSLVELPCPFAGIVDSLLVEEGDTVPVGTAIISVRTGGDTSSSAPTTAEDPHPQTEAQPLLVGYGPRVTSAKRRPRKAAAADGADHAGRENGAPARALAKPPVRKLAKDLGVDLAAVTPTGPGGTVTRDDVQEAATSAQLQQPPPTGTGDLGWHGRAREERLPIRSVRRKTADAVVRSAFTAPHVTEFVTVDVTRSMELADRLRQTREFRDVKLSPLAVAARAMCVAIPRTPEVNARWDDDADEIVLQRYVNLGIAAATPRGLVVPNVKDAHTLSLRDLAVAINQLAETARAGKTPPADMLGGTISITNIGVFGIDAGTPILNPGEAAILAFGAVRQRPWVHEGEVKPRWVTTLGLSFDHRLVDGEQGSRFLSDLASLLEDPGNALAWS